MCEDERSIFDLSLPKGFIIELFGRDEKGPLLPIGENDMFARLCAYTIMIVVFVYMTLVPALAVLEVIVKLGHQLVR
jgi:hypothetical protein